MSEIFESSETLNTAEQVLNLPVQKAIHIAKQYLEEITDGDIEEYKESIKQIEELVEIITSQENVDADADDWHNFAVELARKDLYKLSCKVLDCGLKQTKNIDLLADYLQYGISCKQYDRCKEIYKLLCKIPKIRWNWRAYSFTLNYLMFLWDNCESEKEINKLSLEMLNIVNDFHKHLPYEEEAYKCEAAVYRLLHDFEKEENALRNGLSTIAVAPKCCLRLAMILFERGQYKEALVMVERGIKDTMQTQVSVNEGYLFYLSGLCKMAILQNEGNDYPEDRVLSIYSDFDISLRQERRADYRKTIKAKAIVMESKSGIKVSSEFEELSSLIE